jgi:beta-lactam-binding protein with PASTA domain
VRNRVFAVGAVLATTLALSLVAPATANAASPARRVQPQATVVVPDEVGKNLGPAIDDVLAHGLGLAFGEYKDRVCWYSPYEIVRQSPAAGTVVNTGTVVTLTFAVPPKICP